MASLFLTSITMVNFSFSPIPSFIELKKKKNREQGLQLLATLASSVETSRSKATVHY